MHNQPEYFPGNEKENQNSPEDQSGHTQQDVHISPPHTDRPEGPFEHSGETARQTKAEEAEEKETAKTE